MKRLLLLFCLVYIGQIHCQDILLSNPSFEDLAFSGRVPKGWVDCGRSGESPVDIHPAGTFGVTKPPADGQSYVGMVTRDNGTWEGIGQPLQQPLRVGQCYLFSIFAARSDQYVSISRTTSEPTNFNNPVILRIWGSNNKTCERQELLATTPPIVQTNWRLYAFAFKPEMECRFLTIEAYFPDSLQLNTNGNVLIDFAQNIKAIPCQEARAGINAKQLVPTPATHGLPTDISMPDNPAGLSKFITTVAPEIRFLRTQPTLERWIYRDLQEDILHQNYYLSLIVAAMRKMPNQKLHIGINESEHLAEAEALERELRGELFLLKAPSNIIITKMKRKDFKREWQVDNRLLFFKLEG